jgi:hypothetical protein
MWESIVYGYILASTFLVPVLPETNKFIVNQAFDVFNRNSTSSEYKGGK